MRTKHQVQSGLAKLIDTVQMEKNIPREILIEVIESAMEKAAIQRFGQNRDIEAKYNPEMGEVEIFEFKTIVEEVEDKDTEISLVDAHAHNPEFEVGDSMGTKMDVYDMGRIAAQTAKQFIIQRIRDAEREMTFNEFKAMMKKQY